MTFDSLHLIEPILRSIKTEGYTTPTPIQEQAIPIVLEGKDLLGCAQTGTGKTAAFAIPILQLLVQGQTHASRREKRTIKALILTPTRELAIQIGESFAAYGRHTRLKHTVIFGGVKQLRQTDSLQNGVDILIATPGRLIDLMAQRFVSLKHLEIFVLDEADRMLDMGFVHDVRRIIAVIPPKRQSLFFSATMPPEIVKLADTILVKPEKVEVTPVSSTVDIIQQSVFFVDKDNKNALLLHILEDKSIETALVFTRTKHGADKVVKVLQRHEIKAEAIHGNKSQNARQNALNNFKEKTTRVLVATDIAARGIDVDELAYVINFEIPEIPETYVHRIGRTGRAGAKGTAYSFCDTEERGSLKDIQKLIAKVIPVVEDHPFPLSQKPGNEAAKAHNVAARGNRPSRPNAHSQNQSKPSGATADRDKKPWFKRGR
ncbi:DEAD/DEAH box helicase [Runella slithyformis]|uniref:DEAD-box ATP-dependent RNA helicase RhpA n=1 Tax=Runella slithyformis (strain ATCC 29530 / DSM 19594 / LMG 11500 / NCIMB 11436 / LSU 4) TaxID=761193 RepID=A0A7U4E7M8_RUNSL|nr:DEAD/DEAH box helicase [Runella slithyformis]AEI50831.1 DEAD/DEAH box helicase domain protein [Runella slithyformis DSM 19594]